MDREPRRERPTPINEVVEAMQLSQEERAQILHLANRISSAIGRIHDDEYERLLFEFKRDVGALNDRTDILLQAIVAAEVVARSWAVTVANEKGNPSLTAKISGRAEALAAWLRDVRDKQKKPRA